MSKFKKLFDETQSAFREQPDSAAVVFSTESRQISGFKSAIEARQFRFHADEPEALGGTDSAPNPVEYLLASLAACQEVTYRLYADALGIPVDGISISLDGNLDLRGFLDVADDVRPGVSAITGTVTIDSPAGEADIARLKAVVDRHCPVLDSLTNPTPVTLAINHVRETAVAAE